MIEQIKRRLLIKYPLFGSIIANTDIVLKDEIPTAATDGNKIFYNEEFIKNLTNDEQVFVFAHEICHIAFDHIKRSQGKNLKLWNIATDSVINALLSKDGLPIIKGGVDIKEAINHNAEEMYEKLLKDMKENQQTNTENGNENNSNDNGKDNENNKDGQGQDNKDKNNEDNNQNNDQPDVNNHDMWENAKELSDEADEDENIDEQDAFKENKQERKKQLEELKKQLIKQSQGYGTNEDLRPINNVGTAKPLIDWRRILKEATSHEVDWSYSNATIEEGVITAHLEEYQTPVTEIVLDTSGSIDEELLKNFLRECKNIFQTSKVKVGCFDDKFYGFNEIHSIDDIEKINFIGGGGTNFDAAIEAFSRRAENKIIFTDGWARMPHKPCDCIWVVFGHSKINPMGGKVIYVNEQDLYKKKTR